MIINQNQIYSSLNGGSSQDFLFCEIDTVPDHGKIELRVQIHVVTLQEGGENLLVKESLPER